MDCGKSRAAEGPLKGCAVSRQLARLWRQHADAAVRDPHLEARAAENLRLDLGVPSW
jgi:hypothetical protein